MHKGRTIYFILAHAGFHRTLLCSPLRISVAGHIHWKRTPVYINESVNFVILMKYCLYYSQVFSSVDLNEYLKKYYQEVIMGPVPMNRWGCLVISHYFCRLVGCYFKLAKHLAVNLHPINYHIKSNCLGSSLPQGLRICYSSCLENSFPHPSPGNLSSPFTPLALFSVQVSA